MLITYAVSARCLIKQNKNKGTVNQISQLLPINLLTVLEFRIIILFRDIFGGAIWQF